MSLIDRIRRDWTTLTVLLRVKKRLAHVNPDMTETMADLVERWARETPDATAILSDGETYTYKQYNEAGDRYAAWAVSQGIGLGDTVALLMENRADYLFACLGLAKIGAVTALINTNQKGTALAHSLNISGAKHLILGEELGAHYETATDLLKEPLTVWSCHGNVPGTEDLSSALHAHGDRAFGPADRTGLTGADICFYIYTSGTTGLPKAAKFSHMRFYSGAHGFAASSGASSDDRMYLVLPLYHSAGGVLAVGQMLSVGGSIILKRKFSVSQFWDDCITHDATMFQYIGELCRYLLNTPTHPRETSHRIRCVVGNGLRPDIWNDFKTRFALPRIVEFYGSTEGNVTLINVDGREGSVGRVPWYARKTIPVELVRFDIEREEPVRGPDGLCIPCAPGEVGEAVGRISSDLPRARFEGYSNQEATEKKILHDVFEKGDAYFRTGDLMRRDTENYFYFVDRIGDTFRWKGENVATSEVAEAISVYPGISEVNVYGVAVPGADGRAGMAAIVLADELDLDALYSHLQKELPVYARPLFLRIQPQIETTGTFKHRKVDLVKDGFDPARIADPLYLRDDAANTYQPLDAALYDQINSGTLRL